MNQCVPNWDIDDEANNADQPRLSFIGAATDADGDADAPTPPCLDLSSVDYEVAELTWVNGQLSMHGLGQSRPNPKPTETAGTLESLVNQATSFGNSGIPPDGHKPSFVVPWFQPSQAPTSVAATASATMTMEVQHVPSEAAAGTSDPRRQAAWILGDSVAHGTGVCGCCSAHVGSCSGMGGGNGLLNPGEEGNRKRTSCGDGDWGEHHSASGSATYSHLVSTQDTFDPERGMENNAASHGSPKDMNCVKGGEEEATAAATTEENDSVYSRPQRETEEKRRFGKTSLLTRRSRAAAIHNQSERKRRDKINQRMKTLQKLLPNSSKTDKASVLDEVIDYLKQLQAQVQMVSRMNIPVPVPVPPMLLPLTMQQQLQLSMMAPMGLGLGMPGMPGDMSGIGGNRPSIPVIPPPPYVLHPFMPSGPAAAVMPDPLSAFLASQSSPAMAFDAYNRYAAMYYQQMRPQPPSNPSQ